MICEGCKTIIGLEEEDDTLDCAHCKKVFCSVCMHEADFWQCSKCAEVFCDRCVLVEYYLQTVEDDEDVGDVHYGGAYDDHYLICRHCADAVVTLYEE